MDSLETERLCIRPFTMDDLEEAHRLLDQDIQWAGPEFTLEQRRKKVQLHISLAQWDDTERLYGNRALLLKTSGEMVGFVGFHPDLWPPAWKLAFWPALFGLSPDDATLRCASLELGLGYALSTRHRHQGYAAEAVQAFLDHAFRELRVGRVLAATERGNEDSVALMQRVGMRIARHPDPAAVYPAAVGVIENPGGPS
jgi:ribosomal-protein-alanine N-acetyltransferase